MWLSSSLEVVLVTANCHHYRLAAAMVIAGIDGGWWPLWSLLGLLGGGDCFVVGAGHDPSSGCCRCRKKIHTCSLMLRLERSCVIAAINAVVGLDVVNVDDTAGNGVSDAMGLHDGQGAYL